MGENLGSRQKLEKKIAFLLLLFSDCNRFEEGSLVQRVNALSNRYPL